MKFSVLEQEVKKTFNKTAQWSVQEQMNTKDKATSQKTENQPRFRKIFNQALRKRKDKCIFGTGQVWWKEAKLIIQSEAHDTIQSIEC